MGGIGGGVGGGGVQGFRQGQERRWQICCSDVVDMASNAPLFLNDHRLTYYSMRRAAMVFDSHPSFAMPSYWANNSHCQMVQLSLIQPFKPYHMVHQWHPPLNIVLRMIEKLVSVAGLGGNGVGYPITSRPIIGQSSGLRFKPYCLYYDGIESGLKESNLFDDTGSWENVDAFQRSAPINDDDEIMKITSLETRPTVEKVWIFLKDMRCNIEIDKIYKSYLSLASGELSMNTTIIVTSIPAIWELEAGAVTLLKRIRKFSMAQDIGARVAVHIFNRISFAIAKGVEAQIISRLPSNLL
ncbi:probable LRR receptor-like serine/threonine-protein kinase [Tanacetum coccineum]